STIEPVLRKRLVFEAVVANRPPVVVIRFFLTERAQTPAQTAPIVCHLLAAVKSVGGDAYAAGLFCLNEAEATHGAKQLSRVADFHKPTTG
ncbi:MAG: hypothetical protein ACRDGF_05495, partial [Chloroflexota bacterium]